MNGENNGWRNCHSAFRISNFALGHYPVV